MSSSDHPRLAALFATAVLVDDDPPEPIMQRHAGEPLPCEADCCPMPMCREFRATMRHLGTTGRWPDDSDLDKTEAFP